MNDGWMDEGWEGWTDNGRTDGQIMYGWVTDRWMMAG